MPKRPNYIWLLKSNASANIPLVIRLIMVKRKIKIAGIPSSINNVFKSLINISLNNMFFINCTFPCKVVTQYL